MDVNAVLEQYDALWGTEKPEVSYSFLAENIDRALAEGDRSTAITLMNEMIGMCRDAGFKNEGLKYSAAAIRLMADMGMTETVAYGTTLINVANGCRAYGMFDEAVKFYDEVFALYGRLMDPGDGRMASLYNNRSLLCQEMGDYMGASQMLLKALAIIDAQPDKLTEQATTRANLSQSLIALSAELGENGAALIPRIERYLSESVSMFLKIGGRDFHYSGALGALGDLAVMQSDYRRAGAMYKRGADILELYVGRSDAYDRLIEKWQGCLLKNPERNLERCKKFYEKYGAPVIHEKFPEYEGKIAAGLVGEGSDCLGFDDEFSKDHDFGLGFCMWVDDETYGTVGDKLQETYEDIFTEKKALIEADFGEGICDSSRLSKRRGVFKITEFYENILGAQVGADGILSERDWLGVEEQALSTATNGLVFSDPAGKFTGVRNGLLNHYPEKIFRLRLQKTLHDFSQYLQSNYPRMMGRGDVATARICVAKGAESAMQLAYLLNRTYAPYYKWTRRGMEELPALKNIGPMVDELLSLPVQTEAWAGVNYSSATLNTADQVTVLSEKIAGEILSEMNAQGITSGTDTFLESYCSKVCMED